MALEKLNITPLDQGGNKLLAQSFNVQFNPNSYSVSKSVTWSGSPDRTLNAPPLTFNGGGSRVLTLNLFFDVTEPVNGKPVSDVREETGKIVALSRIRRGLDRPPVVVVAWGGDPPDAANSDFPFTGVVTQLTQTFKLFSSEGQPLRADMTVVFTEFLDPEKDRKQTDPEFTTRLFKRGDSLSGIAAANYRDPGLWRIIAEANNLDDPRHIPVGLRLSIPKRL
jgi:hypothetical protein